MSSRLLACTLLLLASANWVAAQSCCPAAGCCAKPADLPQNPTVDCAKPTTAGQIIIVGNTVTAQSVILDQIPLHPGQVISKADMSEAERNLLRLNIFELDTEKGIRPTVEVLDPDGPDPVKDILVTVQEKCGAFRCGPGDDDEDEEAPKSKCKCDDCSCCGCLNKPGAECACKDECKCCGCKTADTLSDCGTIIIGGLVFCDSSEECECDKDGCKCEKGKCKCDKDACECEEGKCACGDKDGCKCEKGKCKCGDEEGCKCEKGKCKCDEGGCKCGKGKGDCCDKGCGSDCASGKCDQGECKKSKGDCCEGKGCCEKKETGCCPFCPHGMTGCSIGWMMIEEVCPVMRVYAMCPWMQEKVKEVLKPCLKGFVSEYKEMLKAGKTATSCPAEEGACEENGEPQAKKTCHGCGQCAEAGKKVRFWQFHVSKMKQTFGIVIGMKCMAAEQAKDEECPCTTEKAVDEETPKSTETTCPYMQKKQQQEKEKPVSAAELYEKLGTPLENLAKLEKAHALCKRARHFCEAGEYDRAIKCYTKAKELCPGSHYEMVAAEGIQVAQAMKDMDHKVRTVTRELMEKLLEQAIQNHPAATVEESEPDEQPCQEPKAFREYKQKFTDLLDQSRSACAIGDLEKARQLAQEAANLPTPEVMEKVKSLLNNARESFTSGCTSDGWEMLNQALMLDPGSSEARDLQDEMLIKELSNRCNECGSEPCDTLPTTDEDASPSSSPYPPGDGYDPEGGPDQCFDSGSVGKNRPLPAVAVKLLERTVGGEGEEQEGYFLIEVADDDLDLVDDNIAQCDEQAPTDLKTQFRQLANILCENFGLDVDLGKSQPGCTRMSVQIGATEYFLTIDPKGRTLIQVKAVGPEGEGTSKKATEGDAEEAEEPLYPLETDLDPDW